MGETSGFPVKKALADLPSPACVEAQDLSRLSQLKPLITQHLSAILEASHRQRANALSDDKTASHLKTLQRSYLKKLVSKKTDPERIQSLHELIDLAPDAAMDHHSSILSQLLPVVMSEFDAQPSERQHMLSTLIRVFFADMHSAIAIHTGKMTETQASHILSLRKGLERRSIQLEDSKARFRSIFENVSIPLITYDVCGRITRWNRPFEMLLDAPEETIAGRNFFEIFAERNAQERMQSLVDTVFKGEELTNIHWKINMPSGLRRDLSVSTFPVYAASGTVSFGIAMFVDVTEKNELERALLHTEKMAAMGTLASGLAHEIGTPMNVILGRSESLLRHTKEEKTAKGLMIIIEQIDRMTHLINRLLAFARKTPVERKQLALNDLIYSSREIVEPRATAKDILITLDLEAALCPVWGEADQILQVLVNLMMNAVDAIHHGGEISIKTTAIDLSQRHALQTGPRSRQNRMVQILVKDNGSGIDASYLDKIFDPFFTTKAVGKGTGLGLAVACGIIRDHGGQIEVASSEQGSTFCIRLPAEKPGSLKTPVTHPA